MILRGQLKEFIGESDGKQGGRDRPSNDPRDGDPPPREIRMMFGGLAGGETGRKRIADARKARISPKMYEICTTTMCK